ncbi:MAG: hypothetical protein WCS81_01915 [archaeon]|jgi:hypothetical protein
MLEKINFVEVSKVHPAFSGLLVDWSIGSREITATITNLIIKNNIFVVSNKLILNNLNTQYAFEKEFLQIIFENKKELSFLELSSNAYNKYYRKLLTLISKALVTEGYVVENVHDVIVSNLKNKYSKNLNQKAVIVFLKLFSSKSSNSISFGIGDKWISKLGVGNSSINNYLERYGKSSDFVYNYFDLNKFLLDLEIDKNRK